MKVLVLCSRIPYPLHDGGNLAVYNLLEGLQAQGVTLHVLSMNTVRHWVNVEQLPSLFQSFQSFETVRVDNRIKPIAALWSFLKGSSYNLNRFISKKYNQQLTQTLKKEPFDIVLLEGLFVTPYLETIRNHSNAKICYRQHNVEYQIWERLAANCRFLPKRIYLKQLANALKTYELTHLNAYDGIAAISPADAALYKLLGCTLPIADIPYSIKKPKKDAETFPFTRPIKLYHIGAMDWQPNVQALQWFLQEVWPQILDKKPQAELYLAGRNMPDQFQTGMWRHVTVLGEVNDAGIFESDKHILIVPLQSGGGLRIKILEAMSKGKAVVATAVGLQGIDAAKNGATVMIANSSTNFAQACIQLIDNPQMAQNLGNAAQHLVQSHYDQSVVIKKLLAHFNILL